MNRHMTIEQTSISGARTATRISIIKEFCRLVTSVVIRVTRPAVLNLSMLENEKLCILQKTASRKLQAKPAAARAENRPANTPQPRLQKANSSMMAP